MKIEKEVSKIDTPRSVAIYTCPYVSKDISLILLDNIDLNKKYKIYKNTKDLKGKNIKIIELHNSDNYSIMIATDTLPNEKTIKLAYNCDLLIHESTFLDSEIKPDFFKMSSSNFPLTSLNKLSQLSREIPNRYFLIVALLNCLSFRYFLPLLALADLILFSK